MCSSYACSAQGVSRCNDSLLVTVFSAWESRLRLSSPRAKSRRRRAWFLPGSSQPHKWRDEGHADQAGQLADKFQGAERLAQQVQQHGLHAWDVSQPAQPIAAETFAQQRARAKCRRAEGHSRVLMASRHSWYPKDPSTCCGCSGTVGCESGSTASGAATSTCLK